MGWKAGEIMAASTDIIVNALKAFSEANLLQAAALLGLGGVLASATLQLIKDLTPLRLLFHRWWLTRWVAEKLAVTGLDTADATRDRAVSDLIALATGGARSAFFELPPEQMVAQMNAAAAIALEYPSRNGLLLQVLSAGVAPEDFQLIARVDSFSEFEARGTQEERAAASRVRNRISHRIQRNLDAVLIAMGNRWRWGMQVAALLFSVGYIQFVVLWFAKADMLTRDEIVAGMLWAIPIGILGGYLAPLARDLVAAVEGLRKR